MVSKPVLLFFLLLSVLLLPTGPAQAQGQSCSHYLNAIDGDDANNGTRPALAVRSFEHAFRAFPAGATVCMAAGEYVFGRDEDGIQLQGPEVQDKSMTFVLQAFANADTIRFTEDEFVLDIGQGEIRLVEGSAKQIHFGVGNLNNPNNFPSSTTFLHTLALHSGTLDARGVQLTLDAAVGNPAYERPAAPSKRAPATAALVRGTGRLLGAPRFAPAPRVVVYTGAGDRVSGAELPPEAGFRTLRFAHEAGTVTIDRALRLPAESRIAGEQRGEAVFTAPVVVASGGATPIEHRGTGRLAFAGGLRFEMAAPLQPALANTGAGMLDVGAVTFQPAAPGAVEAVLRNSGTGTLALTAFLLPPGVGGAPARPVIDNAEAGTVVLRNDLVLEGRLENRGTVELGIHTLTLAGGTHLNTGRITAAGPQGGVLRLLNTPSLEGEGALPTVEVPSGLPSLPRVRVEGDLRTTGSGGLTLGQGGRVTGSLRVGGTGPVVHEAALEVGQDAVLSAGAMASRGGLHVGRDLVLEGGTHSAEGGVVVAGSARLHAGSFTGNALLRVDGTLEVAGAPLTTPDIEVGSGVLLRSGRLESRTLYAGGDVRAEGGVLTVADAFTVEGSLVLPGGTLTTGGLLQVTSDVVLEGGTLTAASEVLISGGLLLRSGTFTSAAVLQVDEDALVEGATLTSRGRVVLHASLVLRSGRVDSEVIYVGGDVRLEGGTLVPGADLTLQGDFFQTAPGTLDLGAATFTLYGDFARAGGTVVRGTGVLRLSGTGPQALEPGPGLTLHRLAVGGETRVELANTLAVEAGVTIEAEATLALGSRSVRLTGPEAVFTNEGTLSSEPGGTVLFAGDAPAGTPLTQYLGGAGLYGDVEIAMAREDGLVVVASPRVALSGMLSLSRGRIVVPEGRTLVLTHARTVPGLRIDLGGVSPEGATLAPSILANAPGTGTFTIEPPGYHLEYRGRLRAPVVLGAELASPALLDLTLAVESVEQGVLRLGRDVRVNGNLIVGPSAVLDLADHVLVAGGTDAVHNVTGRIVAGSGALAVTATAVVTGSLAPAAPSEIARLVVDTPGFVRVENVKAITEQFEVRRGEAHLGHRAAPPSAPPLRIGRYVQASAGTGVALAAPVQVVHALRVTAGELRQGDHDLLLGDGATLVLGDEARLGSEGSGFIRFTGSGRLEGGTALLPRLRIAPRTPDARVVLASPVHVSQSFIHEGGVLDLGTFTFTHAGPLWRFTGGGYAGTGTVLVTGDLAVELGASPHVPNLTLRGGDAETALRLGATGDTPQTLFVDGTFTLERGVMSLGRQDLGLSGPSPVLDYRAGSFAAIGGDVRDDAANGEVVFYGPGLIRAAQPLTLPAVRFEADTQLERPDPALTVTRRLVLGAGSFSAQRNQALVLSDGIAVVRRQAGRFLFEPAYAGAFDLYYETDGIALGAENALVTHTEILPGGPFPRRVVIDAGENPSGARNTVRLGSDLRVLQAFELRSGAFSPGAYQLTLPAGATLHVDYSGRAEPHFVTDRTVAYAAEGPIVLLFTGTQRYATNDLTFPESIPVAQLRVALADTLGLHAHRQVRTLVVDGETPAAAFDLDGRILTVTEHVTLQRGILTSTTAAAILSIGGDFATFAGTSVTGGILAEVGGFVTLVGSYTATSLETAGNMTVLGQLGGRPAGSTLHVAAAPILRFTGRDQLLLLNNGDDDPATVDDVVGHLVLAQNGTAADGRPRLTIRTDGDVPYTLGVQQLNLQNGLVLTGANDLRLPHDAPGFTHDLGPGRASHVVGFITRPVPAIPPAEPRGPFTFPLGTGYPGAHYRPLTLTFGGDQPVPPQTVLRAGHTDEAPGGLRGFALAAGDSTILVDAADFYWFVGATPSLDPLQAFDLEALATGFDAFDPARVEALRLVRRPAGDPDTSAWRLQGTAGQYDNLLLDEPEPATPLLRVRQTTGGLPAAGILFSVGIEADFVDFGRIQFVHNAPDPTLPAVDLYIDDTLRVDDLAYRRATPYLRLSAGPHRVAVAPADSTDPGAAFYTTTLDVEAGEDYFAATLGFRDADVANPDGRPTAFTLFVTDDARATVPLEEAPGLSLLFVHGTPDAGALGLVDRSGYLTLVEGVGYAAAAPEPLSLPPQSLGLNVTTTDGSGPLLGAFRAELSRYAGASLTVLSTGLLAPQAVPGAPPFSLYLVTAGGETLLPTVVVEAEEPAALPAAIHARGNYPNPFASSTLLVFDLPEAADVHVEVFDLLGRRVLATPAQAFAAGAAQTLRLDAGTLSSGAYFYQLVAHSSAATRTVKGRLVLVR